MAQEELLDIYTDYLICQNQHATATGLSLLLDGLISHDKITRSLNTNEFGSRESLLKAENALLQGRCITLSLIKGLHQILLFDDGLEGEVDLSHLVGKGVFAAWNSINIFNNVQVDPRTSTLTWGDDIDLDPYKENLDRLRREQDKIQLRISKMYDDKLDGLIDTETYCLKLKEYKDKQYEILEQMQRHTVAD